MTETNSLDLAIGKIAAMLSGSPGPVSTPTTTSTPPKTTLPVATIPVSDPLTSAQKNEIAEFVYYTMSVPPITREKLLEMEKGLPEIVNTLRNLNASPTTRSDFLQIIDAVNSQWGSAERSDSDAGLAALAESLRNEAFGEGERIIPIIGLGVACFMAGYTIAHNWDR